MKIYVSWKIGIYEIVNRAHELLPENFLLRKRLKEKKRRKRNMIITLKDGSTKEYAQSMSVYDIALDISEGLARAACAGE